MKETVCEVGILSTINLLTVLTTRMQSVDYKYKRQLWQSMNYILTKDFYKCLFKGFVPAFIGNWIILKSLDLAILYQSADALVVKVTQVYEEETEEGRSKLKEQDKAAEIAFGLKD